MSDSQPHLATILTPKLLYDAFEGRIPWPKEREVDFSLVVDCYFLGDFDVATFRDACYRTLVELSAIPLDNMPNLAQYLPPPEDPSFPVQATGLLLLLDQAPRMLLEGIDERWTLGFFDVLGLRAARHIMTLPEHLFPFAVQRWLDMGYSIGHWLIAYLWALSPLAHSEHLSDHETMLRLLADVRAGVQAHTNTTDPFMSMPERAQMLADPSTLFQALASGPPSGDDVQMEDFAYWIIPGIYEGHTSLVRTFGRAPIYNGALGRDDTEEEKEFLASVGRAGCVAPQVEKRIREDMAAGRWTPLGG